MSFSANKWAWEQGGINGVAKAVLVYLAYCANEDGGDCHPSIATICRRTCHGEMAVRRAIKQLIAAKLVALSQRSLPNGRRTSNSYELTLGTTIPATPTKSRGSKQRRSADATPTKSREHELWKFPLHSHEIEGAIDPHEIEGAGVPDAHEIEGGVSHEIEGGVSHEIEGGFPTKSRETLSTYDSDCTRGSLRSPPARVRGREPCDIRRDVFNEGVALIRGMVGNREAQARGMVGKLCKAANDDCGRVLAAIRRAERERPIDPFPWLLRAVNPNTGRAKADIIREEGNLPTFLTPQLEPEPSIALVECGP